MLNKEAIQNAMQRAGLTQSAIAAACGVSKEAVSNWVAGESVPRPSKLKSLANTLGLAVEELLLKPKLATPVVAYRSFRGRQVSEASKLAAQQVGAALRQLTPLMPRNLLSPRFLEDPRLDDEYIAQAAEEQRNFLKLGPKEVPTVDQIVDALSQAGAVVVPVIWGMNKHGHENALSVYLQEPRCTWVVFNLGCYLDDVKYWLSHELGHCLSLHKLQEEEGETFAEAFAQKFLLPEALVVDCYEAIQATPANKIAVATALANQYGVSVISIVRSADAYAAKNGLAKTGLESPHLFASWARARKEMRTFAEEMFGDPVPPAEDYVTKSEQRFKTPIFDAISQWQKQVGGVSPSFVSSVLNIEIGQAHELARFLAQR